ncbi:MAG: DUF6875 domain-containing protein [Aulosira sp. ZfuVER01]|nr:hypothetical protein [Aulosira sp. ZfuVER01]MDZ7999104.1 hypothetical protein [Aulosira sp. DedVER01a]MDZ8051172.1 hypothetical protein [Aulosira sp. ZfuCHP01]
MQLYTLNEIEQLQQDLPYFIEITEWLKNFVAKPHADVGRPGPVCPYVPPSMKLNSILLRVIRAKDLDIQQIADIVLPHLNTFLELEPKEWPAMLNKAIVFVFPDVNIDDASKIIDVVQAKLKPFFVDAGLMLGEFHKRTESPGLHNPNFRPLRSPIPLLVIRCMTEADLPFMQNTDNLHLRIRYLEAYLQRYEKNIKDQKKLNTAYQALSLARKQLAKENSSNVSLTSSINHIADTH